jgi:quinol monooxygenase YgiN
MSQVVVVVLIKPQQGKVDDVIAGFSPIIEKSQEEEGCLNYALHRNIHDPSSLVLVERWRSQADLDEHFTKPYMADMAQMAGELLDEQPNISFCTPEPIGSPEKGIL